MTPTITHRPYVIGVTGNIACGKSTVLQILRELGAEAIDSDRLYHELIANGEPLWEALRARYGDQIIAADGQIDRRALGAIVFSDPVAMRDLDAITHPAVIEAARRRIADSSAVVLAIDAVKLVESGMHAICDAVWLVECSREVEIERLMKRNGIDRAEAIKRIGSSPPLDDARNVADCVIENTGDLAETCAQVERAWQLLPILQS